MMVRKARQQPQIRMRSEHRRLRPDLLKLRRALVAAAAAAGMGGRRVDVLLTDDRAIARLAGAFRGSPYATDVLAFSYADDPALDGEIAISLDTAVRQAAERRAPLLQELVLLGIHGLLHLQGQGDETRAAWCCMRVREFGLLVQVLR